MVIAKENMNGRVKYNKECPPETMSRMILAMTECIYNIYRTYHENDLTQTFSKGALPTGTQSYRKRLKQLVFQTSGLQTTGACNTS